MMKKDYASPLPKRFYKDVSVEQQGDQWRVLLDGRAVKTVKKQAMLMPDDAIARAVAEEWARVETIINPDRMPLTRLVNIAIDRIPVEREAIFADMMLYAETDLLCHRASEPELRAQQVEHWDPILQMLDNYGIKMVVVTGVIPQPQPQASLDAIRALFKEADHFTFAALAMLVPLLGSVLLTLALWKRNITFDKALYACRLDEEYQRAKWGADAEADAMWQTKANDLRAAATWLSLLS